MTTRADAYRTWHYKELGADYDWGDIPVSPYKTAEERDSDCSGLRIGALRHAGITVPGRPTAHEFYRSGVRIDHPSEIGDYAVHLVDGHAKHIVDFVGDNTMIEARGTGYGVVRYRVDDPRDGAAARHLVWMRNVAVNKRLREVIPGTAVYTPVPVPPYLWVWGVGTEQSADMLARRAHERSQAVTHKGEQRRTVLIHTSDRRNLARELVLYGRSLGLVMHSSPTDETAAGLPAKIATL